MATKVRNSTQRPTQNKRSFGVPFQNQNRNTDFAPISSLVAIRRRENLNKYLAETCSSAFELASRLELTHERTVDLLNGNVMLSNEFATHIEEMLSLPASWLDHGGPIRREPSQSAINIENLPSSDPPYFGQVLDQNGYGHDQNKENAIMNTSVSNVETVQKALVETPERTKQPVSDCRRQNIIMLTERRGSKNVLATLSNMNGSRISLMTSGRKPVSDRFSKAIEEALSLPSGWLDAVHVVEDVPGNVWDLLGCASKEKQAFSKATIEKLHIPEPTVHLPEHQSTETQGRSITESFTRAAASPEKQHMVPSSARKVASIFEKTPGQAGPIAEALAKTVLRLSASDQLSESKAFQLLGLLVESDR